MCGISGFVAPRSAPASLLVGMTDLIGHRGPDDEGFALFYESETQPLLLGRQESIERMASLRLCYAPVRPLGADAPAARVGLGHRRLSIVDLSPAGHQPMCTQEGRHWIVYNGEIYNHLELRAELESLGHRFRSHSDTEVILAAYAQWGEQCLSRLSGMWAFALYDTERQSILLSRDRFGIKPLYYWFAPDGALYFGSEIKQFTGHPDWNARLNRERAYDFLAWGLTDHTDETLFAGVYQLRPGHQARVDAGKPRADASGRLQAKQWYTLAPEPFDGSLEQAATEFRSRFVDAVRTHLQADVPVGSCLSGGLDSSSIVCVIGDLLGQGASASRQATFSAVSDVARFDESRWIREVTQGRPVEAHFVNPPLSRLFDELGRIAWHQDEPFGSTSIYAQWNVFRLAADNGVKVMLDGQGADEQLAGYHGFLGPRFAQLISSGRLLEFWSEAQATQERLGYSKLRALMYAANVLLPSDLKQTLRARSNRNHARPDWIDTECLGVKPRDPLLGLGNYGRTVRSMSIAQLTATNLQMLLRWEDRDSMAHSIESRVPFLDHKLVEFVVGLPDEFKLHRGVTKRVQREAMRGILPEAIRNRSDKMGFVTPEETWMLEQAADAFEAQVSRAIDSSAGVLNGEALSLFRRMRRREAPFSFVPWRMISFGAWMEGFKVSAA